MPTLNLSTNVPVDAVVAADILKDCSKAVARIIGKPESYVMVSINGSVPMSFAASEEPAAYGELVSIGGIGPGVNGKLSAAVAEVLETKLSVSRDPTLASTDPHSEQLQQNRRRWLLRPIIQLNPSIHTISTSINVDHVYHLHLRRRPWKLHH
ncbi:uncharacterized protein [Miscanthus floridulus]|uniref:uncharacterized protein isoform X1 n=1 Tax=Miscanthus floridulus TaxID=154761 RepID=UPI0034586F26